MLLDLTAAATFLILGNILFRHFDPSYTRGYRVRKIAFIVALTVPISFFFGHCGVLIAYGLARISHQGVAKGLGSWDNWFV